MFSELLREKNGIEEKVKRLQYKYLEQLKAYRITEERNSSESETIKGELLKKRGILGSIMNDYKNTLCQLRDLKSLILTTQSLSVNHINNFLDQICISQEIDLPEEITSKTSDVLNRLNDVGEDESDKENSFVDESTFEVYFSPNIQIRKSSAGNLEAYTPALRSNIKK